MNFGIDAIQVTAVGSRITCNPPPMNTDQDWLVLVDLEKFDKIATDLLADDWEVGGSMIPTDDNYLTLQQRFNSFTKGVDNLIVTGSKEFHRRFLAASSVAKRLNLLEKADRIALFQAVLYGTPDSPEFQSVAGFEPLDLSELLNMNEPEEIF